MIPDVVTYANPIELELHLQSIWPSDLRDVVHGGPALFSASRTRSMT
jgi:hypothetical protein